MKIWGGKGKVKGSSGGGEVHSITDVHSGGSTSGAGGEVQVPWEDTSQQRRRLASARKIWERIVKILARERVYGRILGIIYQAVIQSVLLFRRRYGS